MDKLTIFAGRNSQALAWEVFQKLGNTVSASHSSQRFPNQTFRIQIHEAVADQDIFIIQALFPNPHWALMELWQLAWTAKKEGAKHVTAFVTFDPYLRSDKEDKPRVSTTASLISTLNIAAGIDEVVIVEPHFLQISGFYGSHPCHLMKTVDLLAERIRELSLNLKNACVVAPDKGRAEEARILAHLLGDLPVVLLFKKRVSPHKTKIVDMSGTPRKLCITIDDEILYGGTTKAAIQYLKRHNAKQFIITCTHGLFQREAVTYFKRKTEILSIISTNTVPISQKLQDELPKLEVISVAKRIAKIIEGIHFHKDIHDHLILKTL